MMTKPSPKFQPRVSLNMFSSLNHFWGPGFSGFKVTTSPNINWFIDNAHCLQN